jgi:hypothetical protein
MGKIIKLNKINLIIIIILNSYFIISTFLIVKTNIQYLFHITIYMYNIFLYLFYLYVIILWIMGFIIILKNKQLNSLYILILLMIMLFLASYFFYLFLFISTPNLMDEETIKWVNKRLLNKFIK